MQLDSEQWIAERVYRYGEDRRAVLTVRIGPPIKVGEAHYECRIEFVGEPNDLRGVSVGVDGIDAIVSSFRLIVGRLNALNEQVFHNLLAWEFSEPGGPLGIPGAEHLERP